MNTSQTGHYDIIGDIHGHSKTLKELLISLGYEFKNGFYSHESRQAIFLGDFVDRGKGQKDVISIVKPMVENSSALAIMGNHEFNAISYHTAHPKTGEPLRSHNASHNKQHKAFLVEYTNKRDIDDVISWFKTLPIFLELDEIRLIHACWNEDAIAAIQHELDDANCIDDDFIVKANEKDTVQYNAIETLLKGLEITLPDGYSFQDSDGKTRYDIRVKWWEFHETAYNKLALVPEHAKSSMPTSDVPLDELGELKYSPENKPVFFGHYWFTGKSEKQQKNVACLDYSVAGKGDSCFLTAYRWNKGDKEIFDKNFYQVVSQKENHDGSEISH